MVGGPDWEQGTSFPAVLDQGDMEMPPSSSLAQLCSWIFLWLSVLGWKEGSACPLCTLAGSVFLTPDYFFVTLKNHQVFPWISLTK